MDPHSHVDDSWYNPSTQTPFADQAHPHDIGPPGTVQGHDKKIAPS